MVKEVVWSAQAIQEFQSIIAYLKEDWSEREIIAFVSATSRTIEYIMEHPRMFRKTSRPNVHEALITPHNLMIYHFSGSRIEIVTFWDTRRNPKKKKYKTK